MAEFQWPVLGGFLPGHSSTSGQHLPSPRICLLNRKPVAGHTHSSKMPSNQLSSPCSLRGARSHAPQRFAYFRLLPLSGDARCWPR